MFLFMVTNVDPFDIIINVVMGLSCIKRMFVKSYYVYILSSQRNGTLYVGSTSDLVKRVWEHKNKVIKGFTEKYNVNQLVYFETHGSYIEAAKREKRFKNWCRQWKLNLIEELNPTWRDLYQEICS